MNVNWPWSSCRRHREAISLLAADALPATHADAVRAHLQDCGRCQARFEQLRHLVRLGTALPDLLPDATPGHALRRHWTAAITGNGDAPLREPAADWPGLTARRRVAWGTLAVVWALVLFFRLSAPETSKPAVAAVDVTWREVLLALRMERDELRPTPLPAPQSPEPQPQTGFPPRSERRESAPTNSPISV